MTSRPDAALDVLLLGPLEVRIHGEPVDLGGRRPRCLLAALACAAGSVVSVESLVDDVWGPDAPESAIGTLQTYVSNLRRALGDRDRAAPLLARRSGGYVLDLDPAQVDAVRFERLVSEARRLAESDPLAAEALFGDALALWRGPVLADICTEPFVAAHAARLEELRLAAVEDQTELALRLGRHAEIVGRLEALVESNPWRERLTGQLMLALYRSGRQADALRACERTRNRLVDELGLSPSPALVDLERAILGQDPSLDLAPLGADAPEMQGAGIEPRLHIAPPAALVRPDVHAVVGRERQLQALAAAWTEALAGDRKLVAVGGEPGIGKTRLVTEFATGVHADGATVLWGRCTPEVLTAFQPFVEALRPLAGSVPAQVLADTLGPAVSQLSRILPGVLVDRPEPSPLAADTDRYLLFEAIAELVALASRQAPVLLVLEDMHWADPSTGALLVHLARHPKPSAFAIAVTYRPDEVDRRDPLAVAIAELRRDRIVDQIVLEGLDEPATRELLADLVGPEGAAFASVVQERTEGNPFFVEELVAHASETGGLGAGTFGVPESVRDVIERRLDALDNSTRSVLVAAAVLGRVFGIETLAQVVDRDETELLDELEAAVGTGLVEEATDEVGAFTFRHALIRETLYGDVSRLRRSRLHRAAAAAIESRSGDADAAASEIAHHLLAAASPADSGRTIGFAHRAGRFAMDQYSYDEAGTWCRRALDLLDVRPDTEARYGVLMTLGSSLDAVGDAGGARQVYDEAARLARDLGDASGLAHAALAAAAGHASGLGFEFGLVDRPLVELLEEALRLLPARDAPLRIQLLALLSAALYNEADMARSDQASIEAVQLSEAVGHPALLALALFARRTALWRPTGPLQERLRTDALAVEMADAAGDVQLEIMTRLGVIADALEAGDVEAVEQATTEVQERAAPLRQPRWQWFVPVALGGLALLRGHYRQARELIDTALADVGGAQGRNPPLTHALQTLVLRRDTGGDLTEMAERIGRLVQTPTAPLMRALHGLCLAETGDSDAAAAVLAEIGRDDFGALNRDFLWLATMAASAQTAVTIGDMKHVAVLDRLLEGHEDRLTTLGGAGTLGAVAAYRGRLAGLLGDLDRAEALHRAAAATHERIGARPLLARDLVDLARLYRTREHRGDSEQARAALGRARSIAEEIGMVLPETAVLPSA